MATLGDVYRKFGEVSEAAQLLETELGNIVLMVGLVESDLLVKPDKKLASAIFQKVNRQTLGQLLNSASSSVESVAQLEELLIRARDERNRLSHSFYRLHNFRRNSEEGRAVMLADLESIHDTLLEAYKTVLLLSGINLDAVTAQNLPTRHVPI